MKILALDPAARTGWAWSDGSRIERGFWKLGTANNRPGVLADLIRSTVDRLGADVIAFELATFGSKFAVVQAQHNELAGAIRATASALGIPSWGFQPAAWKGRAVGKGNAKMPAIKRALLLYHKIDEKDDDAAAAVGVLMAAQQGPPNETAKQVKRRVKAARKREPRLF